MSYAYAVAVYVKGYCRMTFKEPDTMESTVLRGNLLDCFDLVDTGSYKYIPREKLNADLGLAEGNGVYGYIKMSDGSYVLQTSPGRVAYWSGQADDPAQYVAVRRELV